MAEPAYYPLSPLKNSLERTISPSPEQPLKEDSDLSHPGNTVGVTDPLESRSSVFLAPLRPQPFRKGQSADLWHVMQTPLKMALLPLIAIAYLVFCYTVHGKAVPVKTYGLYAVTPQHLATIKGGITSISIIIISIALYPVYDIVSTLKSEEFFRVLASHSHGVPLDTINRISAPSFGNINMMMTVWRHTCSNYYILGMVASLLIWITATLAPGTLTVDSVLADGELMAFAIGAVPPQSVLNGTNPGESATNASLNADTAASITWAEMELGVQYSFGMANTSEPDYTAFIAPVPLDLSTTTSARWLSDVIGIKPTCSWASTNLTSTVQIPTNLSSALDQDLAIGLYLPDFNLDVQVLSDEIPVGDTAFATVKDPTYSVVNHTTKAPPVDGSTVFLLGQCQSGTACSSAFIDVTLDMTGSNTTFTITFTDQTWTMAVLVCLPNITIETREVRNDGYGLFSVQPLSAGLQLMRQGNLNPIQTTALFSIATMSLTSKAGPLSGNLISYSSLGSLVQVDLLYGKAQFASLPGLDAPFGTPVTISLAPIENITQGYTQILQSVAKSYLNGYLGTAYVPGRISATELVFAASVPNLAVSSAVFVLLMALIILVHFRPGKGVEFTLVNVAAAVHGSELPAQFVEIMAGQVAVEYGHIDVEAEGDPATDGNDGVVGKGKVRRVENDAPQNQPDVVEILGDKRIYMQKRSDGFPVLHLD